MTINTKLEQPATTHSLTCWEAYKLLDKVMFTENPGYTRYDGSKFFGVDAVVAILMDTQPLDRGKVAEYCVPGIPYCPLHFMDEEARERHLPHFIWEIQNAISIISNGKRAISEDYVPSLWVQWQKNFKAMKKRKTHKKTA